MGYACGSIPSLKMASCMLYLVRNLGLIMKGNLCIFCVTVAVYLSFLHLICARRIVLTNFSFLCQLGYTKKQEERHFRGVITLEV